jgi:hypothetical protein
VEAPPIGRLEVNTIAREVIASATHSDLEEHESACRPNVSGTPLAGPIRAACHAFLPLVGRLELSTYPAASNAAQNDDGHDTPSNGASSMQLPGTMQYWKWSTWATRHALRPPAGCVEVITSPAASTAAQNDRDGQETDVNTPFVFS